MHGNEVLAAAACLWAMLAPLPSAMAQSHQVPASKAPRQVMAVPYYTPGMYVQGLLANRHAPLAGWLARQSEVLLSKVQSLCAASPPQAAPALQGARDQWAQAMATWTALSTVAIGPIIERRSIRQLDFQPARPALILKAIAAAPPDVSALDTVGAPARGFPALEWLLWASPAISPGTPSCSYAVVLATELMQQSVALDAAYTAQARRDWDEADAEAASTLMGEVVNQWTGAIEQLRWRDLGKPLASAMGKRPEFPRALSRKTAMAWAAQWQAIKVVASQGAAPVPPGGSGLMVPLELYLRGKGQNGPADALARAVARADAALNNLSPRQSPARLQAAITALGELKQVAEAEVAPALQISIGFSDADGD
jgi:predicted lipoprotein